MVAHTVVLSSPLVACTAAFVVVVTVGAWCAVVATLWPGEVLHSCLLCWKSAKHCCANGPGTGHQDVETAKQQNACSPGTGRQDVETAKRVNAHGPGTGRQDVEAAKQLNAHCHGTGRDVEGAKHLNACSPGTGHQDVEENAKQRNA
jgi:hypothetical protein